MSQIPQQVSSYRCTSLHRASISFFGVSRPKLIARFHKRAGPCGECLRTCWNAEKRRTSKGTRRPEQIYLAGEFGGLLTYFLLYGFALDDEPKLNASNRSAIAGLFSGT